METIIIPIPLFWFVLLIGFVVSVVWILSTAYLDALAERDLQKKRGDFLSQSLSKLREKLQDLADDDLEN